MHHMLKYMRVFLCHGPCLCCTLHPHGCQLLVNDQVLCAGMLLNAYLYCLCRIVQVSFQIPFNMWGKKTVTTFCFWYQIQIYLKGFMSLSVVAVCEVVPHQPQLLYYFRPPLLDLSFRHVPLDSVSVPVYSCPFCTGV